MAFNESTPRLNREDGAVVMQPDLARWLLSTLRPSLMVDAAAPQRDSYFLWCDAIRSLGMSTHCYFVESARSPLVIGSPVDAAGAAPSDFSSFSHILDAGEDIAISTLPDGAVDLIVLGQSAGSRSLRARVDAWLPKLSASGVVMLKGTDGADGITSGSADWEWARNKYPSMELNNGRYLLLLAGADASSSIRGVFVPQDADNLAAADLPLRQTLEPDATLDALRVQLVAQSDELERLRSALLEASSSREFYQKKIRALSRALENASVSSQASSQALSDTRHQVSAMLRSRSWMVTSPLRAASTAVRYGRDVLRGGVRVTKNLGHHARAKGWKALSVYALTSVTKPRQALRMLTGHTGSELDATYKLAPGRPATETLEQRVLLIAELSLSQCLKYRVLQKQQMIQHLGIDCTIVNWHDLASARDYLQTHTVVIFYRVPGYEVQLETIRLAKSMGIPTFWEVDDLIFDAELYETNSNILDLNKRTRASLMSGVPLYRAAMLACDACIASTTALAEVMQSVGVKKVFIVENALDDETTELAEEINASPARGDGLIRIVYGSGSSSHDADFRVAAPAIHRVLSARYDVRLTVIGSLNLPENFKSLEAQIERLPPSDYGTYMRRLSRCHINIAPLEASIFNDAKSNIKYLEAAILKIPSVCSPTTEYRETIDDGVTGLLAATSEDWERLLMRLIDDPVLRRNIGERAHEHVVAHYTPEKMAEQRVAPIIEPFAQFKPKALRVLGVNIFFEPRSFGGATIVAEEIARRINRRDDVEYAMMTSLPTSDVHPYKVVRYQSSAAEVFAMGLPFEGNPAFDFDNPYPNGAFLEILRSWKPDVVHLHSIQGFGVQIAEVCRAEGIPFVVTLHDAWWICARQFMITNEGKYCHQRKVDINVCAKCVVNPALNPYRQFRLHEVLSMASMLITPSAFFRQLYIDNGFDANKIVVNKNGVVPPKKLVSRSPASTRPLRFGFVGGEGPAKGSELIKEVLRKLPNTNYELHVVDAALNLGRRVIFESTWAIPGVLKIVPAYTQETIDDFFESIDVLLFPTQCKESFGLSVREAMIRDVWVIATDAGGAVEDIVPGENGDVVPLEDDGLFFMAAVKAILDNPGRLDGFRNRHVNMIRVFDEQAAELTNILEGVVQQHSAALN